MVNRRSALRRFALAVTLAALAALPGLAGCGSAQLPPSAPHQLANQPVPDFKRRTLEGGEVDTASLRGRVVVVKFFAKYCEPCKKTLPAVEALAQDRKDITVVGIAEDERESDVREVVGTYKLTFPVVHDASNVLSGRYRVNEMPVTFVVDPAGTIRWIGGPGQSEADIVQAIQAVAH